MKVEKRNERKYMKQKVEIKNNFFVFLLFCVPLIIGQPYLTNPIVCDKHDVNELTRKEGVVVLSLSFCL